MIVVTKEDRHGVYTIRVECRNVDDSPSWAISVAGTTWDLDYSVVKSELINSWKEESVSEVIYRSLGYVMQEIKTIAEIGEGIKSRLEKHDIAGD